MRPGHYRKSGGYPRYSSRWFKKAVIVTVSFLLVNLFLAACGGSAEGVDSSGAQGGSRDTTPHVLVPEAPGTDLLGNGSVSIDVSNRNDGYITVQYNGSNSDPRMLLQYGSEEPLQYLLHAGRSDVIPLVSGSGKYTVEVLENISGSQYETISKDSIDVEITDEFLPALYPNQYIWFTSSSNAVAKGAEVAAGSDNDIDVIKKIYDFVVTDIVYDDAKTQEVEYGYLPDVDETLSEKKGICFDYAALMTAMLRSQGIPTKLVIGYAGDIYHAWISVYTEEKGWIENAIEFHGNEWVRMDPTFASTTGQGINFVDDTIVYNDLETY